MQPFERQSQFQYMLQLDSLRAIAVLGVLIHHFYPESEALGLGYYGVRLFFVLSGFLITGILLDSRKRIEQTRQRITSAICQFYIRRSLRIVPVYYIALAMALLLGNTDVASGAWWYTTYTTNFFFINLGFYPSTTAHLWSLSVEAQFYLIWPFVVFLVAKRRIHWAIVLTILAGPIYRLWAILGSHEGVEFYTFTLSSIDSLGWGALFAWLLHHEKKVHGLELVGPGLFLLLLIVTPIMMEETYFYVLDNTLLSIAFVWLISGAARGFIGSVGVIMNWKPLTYIGQISYGVYLYHLFVPWGLYEVLDLTQPENSFLNAILLMTVTILLASFSWHFFEKPVNALKKHFPYQDLIPKAQRGHDFGSAVGSWRYQRN